jgi:8-oxo-dGTP pyrophosphatase MutT (NUDIX family)
MNQRRIFDCDKISDSRVIDSLRDKKSLYTKTISACGCLFYKIVDGHLSLLLIRYTGSSGRHELDDFGGKIDVTDQSVYETVLREVGEETNHVIDCGYLKHRLENGPYRVFYTPQSKYYLFVMPVNADFFPDTTLFGTEEQHDHLPRVVAWYSYPECKQLLAQRLVSNKALIGYLDSLS